MPKKIYGKSKRKQAPSRAKVKKVSLGKKVGSKPRKAISKRNKALRDAMKGL